MSKHGGGDAQKGDSEQNLKKSNSLEEPEAAQASQGPDYRQDVFFAGGYVGDLTEKCTKCAGLPVRVFIVQSDYDGSVRCAFHSRDAAEFYVQMVERYSPNSAGDCTIHERILNSHDWE